MKTGAALVGILAICAHVPIAQGGFFTGNDLKARLEDWTNQNSTATVKASMGAGYVVGVADAIDGEYICMPDGVTVGQLNSIVLNYLRQHPEELHKSAAVLSYKALQPAFPCKQKAAADDPATPAPTETNTHTKPKPAARPKPKERPESPFN